MFIRTEQTFFKKLINSLEADPECVKHLRRRVISIYLCNKTLDICLLIIINSFWGVTIDGLWKVMENRQPSIDCVIDEWTKPAIWEDIVLSEHIHFYLVDFNGEKQPDIPSSKKVFVRSISRIWQIEWNSLIDRLHEISLHINAVSIKGVSIIWVLIIVKMSIDLDYFWASVYVPIW